MTATRELAIAAAGSALADALRHRDAMTVEDAAAAAYTPTGPSLADLEQRIRQDRLDRLAHTAAPGAA